MIPLTSLIHYSVISIISALTGMGVGIGQGITTYSALKAIDRQPAAQPEISKSLILALAIIETAAIIGLIFIMILFFKETTDLNKSIAQIGIAFALGIPGFVIGIACALPACAALNSIARQPFLSRKITNAMLLTQSVIQTPLIFGFLVAIVINYKLTFVDSLAQALSLVASGLCIGIASIGPAIGLGYFTYTAANSLGKNSEAYNKILSFTFISQAIIETPVIFAAIISFWIAQTYIDPTRGIATGILCIASAIVMGIGTFGPGISSGRTAAAACAYIALKPQLYTVLSRTSMIIQGLIDTAAIYAFIIALVILLVGL